MSTFNSPDSAENAGPPPYGLPSSEPGQPQAVPGAGPGPNATSPNGHAGPPALGAPPQTEPAPQPPANEPETIKGLITTAQPVRADLLPLSYRQRMALAGARRATVLALIAALAVVVVGFLLASLQVSSATTARNAAVAEKASAEQAVAALAEVPRITNLVTKVSASLEIALTNEILFSQLTAETASALPPGTVLETMSWSLVEPTEALAAAAVDEVDLGDMSLDGSICQFVGGATLLDSLNGVQSLQNVWLSSQSFTDLGPPGSACAGQPEYTFAITADLSEDALSNRFVAEDAATTGGGQQ